MCVSDPVHPAPFDTTTVYVVVAVGETVIVCVTAPVDHEYEECPGPASSVTLPPHDVVGPVMIGAGVALIGTFAVLVAEHPAPFVTVSVSPTEPDAPASYVMFWIVFELVIVPLVIDHE